MAEINDHSALYQETLETALEEATDLTDRIEYLRDLLSQLERRKHAVENICRAIGRWVEVIDHKQPEQSNSLSLPLNDQEAPILLSEEEVSLLAYPAETS